MEIDGNSKILLLEQAFNNYKHETNNILDELKINILNIDNRVKYMEISKEKTDYQYSQIIENLKTLNEKTIPNLTAQIQELKNKPAKRYEQFIAGIIGAIAGASGTFIASLFLKNRREFKI